MSRSTSLVLRPLPQRSYLHELWAGTKLLAVAALSVVLTVAPSWPVVGLFAVLLVLAAAAARIPLSVVPGVPRWVLVVTAIGGGLMVASGGAPFVHLGAVSLGLGGLSNLLRIVLLGLVLLGAGALIAWTTDPADVAPAVARLMRPLRPLRVPVDEWAVTLALALRTFPLMLDEFRTLAPGTMYLLDGHERHTVTTKTRMRMLCVFNPPVVGTEVHDENGVYPLVAVD